VLRNGRKVACFPGLTIYSLLVQHDGSHESQVIRHSLVNSSDHHAYVAQLLFHLGSNVESFFDPFYTLLLFGLVLRIRVATGSFIRQLLLTEAHQLFHVLFPNLLLWVQFFAHDLLLQELLAMRVLFEFVEGCDGCR